MNNNIDLELKKAQLRYYNSLNKDREQVEINKQNEERLTSESWDKFSRLNQKTVTLDIFSIIKKKIEEESQISSYDFKDYESMLRCSDLYDYFLSKGVDLNYVVRRNIQTQAVYDYFNTYGTKEKLKWNNIALDLKNKTEIVKKDYENRKFKIFKEKFVKKAIEMNLMDVTQAHIKAMAVELNEDVNGILGQLAVGVSVKLKEHWGNNKPKYHKRGITSSRRVDVFSRDGNKCDQCGRNKSEIGLHVQHITPESMGGTDEMDNLITLCSECNLSIGNSKYNPSDKWIESIGKHIYKRWGKKD